MSAKSSLILASRITFASPTLHAEVAPEPVLDLTCKDRCDQRYNDRLTALKIELAEFIDQAKCAAKYNYTVLKQVAAYSQAAIDIAAKRLYIENEKRRAAAMLQSCKGLCQVTNPQFECRVGCYETAGLEIEAIRDEQNDRNNATAARHQSGVIIDTRINENLSRALDSIATQANATVFEVQTQEDICIYYCDFEKRRRNGFYFPVAIEGPPAQSTPVTPHQDIEQANAIHNPMPTLEPITPARVLPRRGNVGAAIIPSAQQSAPQNPALDR